MEPCPHAAFDSAVVVVRPSHYVEVRLRVQCTACHSEVVFDGLPVAVEAIFQTVAVARRGTEVRLAGQMALAVEEEAAPWVRTQVVLPTPPREET